MSKKLLAILLSVIMIVTTVFTGMTVSAEDVTNYVGDGGFESANFSSIPRFGDSATSTATQTWGRFSSGVTRMEVVTSANYGAEDSTELNGNQYMKSGVSASGGYIRAFGQILNLTAGDYVLTFIAKSDLSNTFSASVYPSTVPSINLPKALGYTYLDASTTWKEYTVEFTAPTDAKYHLMMGGYADGVSNISLFYIDNVAVCKKVSEVNTVNINATAEVGGTVTGGGEYQKGDTVTLTASAAKSGYEFAGWSDGVTTATRTFTADADVTLTAKYNKITADYVPNGNFEADDWSLSDYWTTLSGNAAFVEAKDPTNTNNTVAYAKGSTAATSMISKQTITLKAGHTYVIRFDSYMANAVTGSGISFYRVGFINPGVANLGGSSFVPANVYYNVYGSTPSTNYGTWSKGMSPSFTPSADTEVHIAIGMYSNACTSDWYVDNIVVYDTADLCNVTAEAENGTATGSKSGIFKGETVTLKATSNGDNYKFLGWFAEGSDTAVATTEEWTFRATGTATYTAKYVYSSKNLVVNGDFEANDNITTSRLEANSATGTWGLIETGVHRLDHITSDKYVKDVDRTDVNGSGYLQSGSINLAHVRNWGQNVTLEPNTNYVLSFIAKSDEFVGTDSKTFPIYAAVKARAVRLDQPSDGINGACATIEPSAAWKEYKVTFNSGSNTDAAVVFGNYANVNTAYAYAIDNVVLCKEADYGVGYNAISTFENGIDGWTATEGATVTATDTSGTALKNLTQYVGDKVGVLTPAKEGDVFTSPAFATEIGKTYDVVIYARRNSDAEPHGEYTFSAGGANESLRYAAYGAGDTFENRLGFTYTLADADDATMQFGDFRQLIFTFTATAESHRISLTTVTAVSVFVDGFAVYSRDDISTYVEDGIGFNGTAIRTEGVQGLRFKSSIRLDTLSNMGSYAKVVEYGTLAIKDAYIDGDLTIEDLTNGKYAYEKNDGTPSCRLKLGVAYNTESGKNVLFDVNIYSNIFTGVLTGISANNYDADYTTRVYAKIQFADGSYTYVYGEHNSASIKAVAQHIVDNNLETEEVREYLQTNILGE